MLMKKVKTIQIILLAIFCGLVFSCQQIPEDEEVLSEIEGGLELVDWKGSVEVDFGCGENESPEDVLMAVPQVGTIWNGMIVADIVEADDTGASLLLMTLEQWEDAVSQVDGILSGYSVNGVSGWRLPTHEEASVLRTRFSGIGRTELNDMIAEYDVSLNGLDGEERYLCTKNDVFYSFKFEEGTSITKAGEKRSYYIRLVKTCRVSLL